MTPSRTCGQTNLPPSSRLWINTIPVRSQTRTFSLSARFDRNTNTAPLNGSSPIISCTAAASHLQPPGKPLDWDVQMGAHFAVSMCDSSWPFTSCADVLDLAKRPMREDQLKGAGVNSASRVILQGRHGVMRRTE